MDTDTILEDIDINVMCRACALRFDLSVLRDITPPMRDAFLSCTGIEVDLFSEDMPTHICGTCWSRADNASQFKLQCQQSEKKLFSLLSTKKGHSVCSTPARIDDIEQDDEFVNGSCGISHPYPQSAVKVRMMPSDTGGCLASSTPNHLDDDEQTEENGGGASGIPNLTLLELAIPVTSVGCDDGVNYERALHQDDGSQNRDDASRVNDILNEILYDRDDLKGKEDDKQSHIINPDSVLSFLNCDESTQRNCENISIDSFSLIENLNASKELNSTSEHIEDESPKGESMRNYQYEKNNNSENIYNVIHPEIYDYKHRYPKILLIDYIKRSMPEDAATKELKELGHVRCRYCFRIYGSPNSLYIHLTEKHGTDCLYHSNGLDSIKTTHPETWIKKKLNEINGFVGCKMCRQRFASVRCLYKHLKSGHSEKEMLSKAMDRRINELIKESCKDYYVCDYCGKEYKGRTRFCRHIGSHRKRKYNYVCVKCGRSFEKRNSYIQHAKSHTVKIPNSMPEQSVNDPTSKSRFVCSICGKSLSNQWNLTAHMKRHTSCVKSVCNVCNRGFDMPQDLRRHVKSHSKSSYKYKCRFCERTFARSDNLTKHVSRIHLDDRVYVCTDCGQDFKYEVCLKNHIRKVHGIGTADSAKKKNEANGLKDDAVTRDDALNGVTED